MAKHAHTEAYTVHQLFPAHSTFIMSQTFVLHPEILPLGKMYSNAKTLTAGGSWR